MNNNTSTSVVQKYLEEDFFNGVDCAIKMKRSERKVVKRMPKIVTNSVLMTLLDPTLRNANKPNALIVNKSTIEQVVENKKQADQFKIPKRKNYSVLASALNQPIINYSISNKASSRANSRKISESINLIKLYEYEEQENKQVRQIRRIKQLQGRFQEQKLKNMIQNDIKNNNSGREKKNSLSECLYHHTYDYQTNIIRVDPIHMQNFPSPEQKVSLLDAIKGNLDQQIQNDRLQIRLKQIEEFNRKQVRQIPLNKIQRGVSETKNQIKYKQQGKQQKNIKNMLIDPKIKPYHRFERSDINSLSKNIQNYLSEGIKLITHEEIIVQQVQQQDKKYKVQEKHIVKEKQRIRKQKSNSSQSIVFTYQKNQHKNSSVIQTQTNPIAESKCQGQHKSLQLQKDRKAQKYDALTQMIRKYTNKLTVDTQSIQNYIRLPAINRSPRKVILKKRNATEQKRMKGLQGIQVNINTPMSKQTNKVNSRLGYFSALSVNKQTQSSLEEVDSDRLGSGRSDVRSKKQYVHEYFNNYKEQFRHKMKELSKVIKLYN